MLPESWWKQSCLWKQWHSYWEERFHMQECVLTLFKWFQTCCSSYWLYAGCAGSVHETMGVCMRTLPPPPLSIHTITHLNIFVVGAPLICSTRCCITCQWLYGTTLLKPKCTPSCSDTSVFESYSKRWVPPMENAMDQCHSKMLIMVFYIIAGPPSSFLSLDLAFFDSQMLARKKDFWVVPTSLNKSKRKFKEKQ